MPTPSDSHDYGRFDELAEEFADRYRRGERPTVEEYIDRLPAMAAEIREMFPALVELHQVDQAYVDHANQVNTGGPAQRLQQIGDYRILGEIGRGGMGVVYEAEQISLGRRVALKVLPRHVAGDRMTLERFRREARAAARLHHTNIVPVFEVGQDGDVRFYAMQFIQGQSLDTVITELRHLRIQSQSRGNDDEKTPGLGQSRSLAPSVAHSILTGGFLPQADVRVPSGIAGARTEVQAGTVALALARAAGVGVEATEARADSQFAPDSSSSPTPLTSALLPGGTQLSVAEMSHRVFHRSVAHIGRQAASALAHAHTRGVIHRDIKPSNLLLDTDGVVWVTDFGLAKAEDEGLTQTGDVLGTIRYMAPERFSGAADPRSDVYALGLTLYELLILRPAFDSPNRLALIDLVKNVDPPRPRSIDPRIPLDLETIVSKAVEKDPKSRYASADALGEDLRRFLADEPIQARQISTMERYWRWARRNPLIATLGGVLTAVLVMATIVSLIVAGRMTNLARNEARAAADERMARQQAVDAQKRAVDAQKREAGQRDRAESTLYFSRIALAERAWEANEVLAATQQLALCRPEPGELDRRGWEWRYLNGLCHAELARADDPESVYGIAFSPDGRYLVTSTYFLDKTRTRIRVRDPHTARALHTFDGPALHANLRFSEDGLRLLVDDNRRAHFPDGRRTAAAYEAGTWQPVPLAPGDAGPTGSERLIEIERVTPGNAIAVRDGGRLYPLSGHTGETTAVAATPDGRLIATASSDQTIRLWDRRGELLGVLRGHTSGLYCLAWSADGCRLASTSADGTIRLWDLTRDQRGLNPHFGRQLFEGGGEWLGNMAFGPDGRTLRVLGMESAEFGEPSLLLTLDSAAGVLRSHRMLPTLAYARSVDELTSGARATAFSADGRLVAGPRRGRPASLSVCETATGAEVLALPIKPRAVAFSPDGARIAVAAADSDAIRIWDVGTNRELASPGPIDLTPAERLNLYRMTAESASSYPYPAMMLQQAASGLVMDPDLAPSYAAEAVVWVRKAADTQAADTDLLQTLGLALLRAGDWRAASDALNRSNERAPEPAVTTDYALALCASHLGQEEHARRYFDRAVAAETKQPSAAPGIREQLRSEAARQLGLAATWQPTGVRSTPFLLRPRCLEFSPDGRTLAAGLGGAGVAFWDSLSGRLLGRSSEIRSVLSPSFRPDGRRVAFVDPALGKVVVVDVPGGSPIFAVDGPGGPGRLESVAFSPDGRRIAASGRTGDVHILDAETGQGVINLRRLSPPPGGTYGFRALVTFSDDGRRLAATNSDGHITIWDVNTDVSGTLEERERLAAVRAGEIDFRAEPIREIAAAGFAGPLFSRIKQLLDAEPLNGFAYRYAAILAAAGDLDAYRRLSRSVFARYAQTNAWDNAQRAALLAALIPGAASDPDAVVELALRAVKTEKHSAVVRMTHALALHRAGSDALAVRTYGGRGETSTNSDEAGPMMQLALALAYESLGQAAEARARFDQARRLMRQVVGPEGLDGVLPPDAAAWLRCRILLREAEAKILYDPVFPVHPFAR